MGKSKLRIVELYAGTGRAIEPFRKWRKAEIALLVDNNPYAKEVYTRNFPDAPYLRADLSRLSADGLARAAGGRVDILLGCPPCQGYSDVGLKEDDDPRNGHITRFLNYVRNLKPMAIAMENVPLAAASDRFKQLTRGIERYGYVWTATIANAALWGSCQSRQRLVLVAIRNDIKQTPKFSEPTHGSGKYFSYSLLKRSKLAGDRIGILGTTPATMRIAGLLPENYLQKTGRKKIPTLSEVIDDLPEVDSEAGKKLGHFTWGHKPEMLRRMRDIKEGGRWRGGEDHFSQAYGRLHRDGLARTITTFFANPGSGRFWHPTENRSLTLREAARIQGFPDDFQFLGRPTSNRVLIGNALDDALAKLSSCSIMDCLS